MGLGILFIYPIVLFVPRIIGSGCYAALGKSEDKGLLDACGFVGIDSCLHDQECEPSIIDKVDFRHTFAQLCVRRFAHHLNDRAFGWIDLFHLLQKF